MQFLKTTLKCLIVFPLGMGLALFTILIMVPGMMFGSGNPWPTLLGFHFITSALCFPGSYLIVSDYTVDGGRRFIAAVILSPVPVLLLYGLLALIAVYN
jgi:hypothetical protein